MKPKTKEKKMKRLKNQFFAHEGNENKQLNLSQRYETLKQTK
jgi:hypothetical protein